MEKGLQTTFATATGLLLILIGILGFLTQFLTFSTSTAHNVIHLVLGFLYTVAGVWGGRRIAKRANTWLGVGIMVLAAIGLAGFGHLIHAGTAYTIVHICIGVLSTLIGVRGEAVADSRARPRVF